MYATRNGRILASVAALAGCWFLAYLVMLSDIDFFTFEDLFDTTEPHHEHIVAALILLGIVLAVVPFLSDWMARRPR